MILRDLLYQSYAVYVALNETYTSRDNETYHSIANSRLRAEYFASGRTPAGYTGKYPVITDAIKARADAELIELEGIYVYHSLMNPNMSEFDQSMMKAVREVISDDNTELVDQCAQPGLILYFAEAYKKMKKTLTVQDQIAALDNDYLSVPTSSTEFEVLSKRNSDEFIAVTAKADNKLVSFFAGYGSGMAKVLDKSNNFTAKSFKIKRQQYSNYHNKAETVINYIRVEA